MRFNKITFTLFLIACLLLSACSESVSEISEKDISHSGILNNGALYITVENESYVYTEAIPSNKDACGELITSIDAERVYKDKSCSDLSRVILASSDGEYKEYSFASDKRHFTNEENEIRTIAEAEILKRYPKTDFSNYRIDVDVGDDGRIWVDYDIMYCGYHGNSSFSIDMSPDKEIVDFDLINEDYYAFADKVSAQKVREAELKLQAQAAKYKDDDSSGYYITLDKDGNLCLSCEIIVEYDLIGYITEGCGYDHEHVFLNEIICCK